MKNKIYSFLNISTVNYYSQKEIGIHVIAPSIKTSRKYYIDVLAPFITK